MDWIIVKRWTVQPLGTIYVDDGDGNCIGVAEYDPYVRERMQSFEASRVEAERSAFWERRWAEQRGEQCEFLVVPCNEYGKSF